MVFDYTPLYMFILLMLALAFGIPISFSLLIVALLFGTALWGEQLHTYRYPSFYFYGIGSTKGTGSGRSL